ncbi:MAG: TIGR03617 family F420-dependent LLM class oxidoreductase [Acidimicrobiales bacterium]|nr:TIGR03617 family F420-dependent LLM class oxidoreductase [Acidimicrobiales bacterium]
MLGVHGAWGVRPGGSVVDAVAAWRLWFCGVMRFDLMTGGLPLTRMQDLARDAHAAGFDGLVVTEAGRTAYLGCAVASLAAPVDVLTGIAVAFARSPMVTAATAWELAEASGGRFRLGLGTQVRAHIERRYGMCFDSPGPRLREYVLAVRACFAAFRGSAPLNFDGQYWKLSLLPPMWSPGPIAFPDPPIDVAAVNPWMLRMAGQVADGVHVHPLNTPTYLREMVLPCLAQGVAAAGRSLGELEVIVPCFIAPGDSEEDRRQWWELARAQVAFYGSTPNYAFIFDQIGFDGTTAKLRERQKAGDLAGMISVISDECLAHFVVAGTWDEIGSALVERYRGVATRVVDYFAAQAWARDPGSLKRWASVADAVHAA